MNNSVNSPADGAVNSAAHRDPLEPGPVAWGFIVLGFVIMGVALLGVFREADQADPANWIPWLVGAAIVHDGIVLPLVLLCGIGFASIGRPGIRAALRWAVAVGAVVTLATWPVVRRWGAQPGDPSELPLQAGRNLLILWAVLLVGAVVVGLYLEARRPSSGPAAQEPAP